MSFLGLQFLNRINPFRKLLTWAAGKPKWEILGHAAIIASGIGLTILKTHFHSQAFRAQGFSSEQCEALETQEKVRQTISTVLWLTTLESAAAIILKFLPRYPEALRIPTAGLLSQLPDTFIRPPLTAWVTAKLMKKKPLSSQQPLFPSLQTSQTAFPIMPPVTQVQAAAQPYSVPRSNRVLSYTRINVLNLYGIPPYTRVNPLTV